jgi:hypothetical protein
VSCRRDAPITGDAAGVEERRDRRRLGPVLAVLHHADGGVRGVDREHQLHHALVVAALDPVAGVAEDLDHLDVLGQHLGHEPVDAVLAAGLREVLEEELGDAATLVRVLDQERHLGLTRGHDVVAPDRDHPARHGEHERDPVVVVDGAEPGDVTLGQLGHRGEEAEVLRLVGHPVVEADQQLLVIGADRPQVRRVAVAEQDVGLPVGRVGRLLGRGGHIGECTGRG